MFKWRGNYTTAQCTDFTILKLKFTSKSNIKQKVSIHYLLKILIVLFNNDGFKQTDIIVNSWTIDKIVC